MDSSGGRSAERPSFTLVELVVVLIVLAMLASAVTVSLAGPIRRARLMETLDRVVSLDAEARLIARRTAAGAVLKFEADSAVIEGGRRERWRASVQVDAGPVVVIAPSGQSTSYAVRVSTGEVSRWLVVLGLSGQAVPVASQGEADALLRQ